MAPSLSPLARIVLHALDAARVSAPATADEIARTTRLPPLVVEWALAELRNAGRGEECEPRRFRLAR